MIPSIPGRAGKTRQRRYSSGSNTPIPPDQGDLTIILPGEPLPPGANFSRGTVATFFELEGGLESNDNRFLRYAAIDEIRDNHWETWPVATTDPFYRRTFLIEDGRQTLSTFSEDLSNAIWVKDGTSVTVNDTEAPDEAMTMDKLVEDGALSEHEFNINVSFSAGAVSAAVFFKAGERKFCELRIESQGNSANFLRILVDGTQAPNYRIIQEEVGGTAVVQMSHIDNKINGSCRIMIGGDFQSPNMNVRVRLLDDNLDYSYQGDGTSGAFFWGMQAENDIIVSSYIPALDATTPVIRVSDFFSFVPLNPQQVPFSIQSSWVERGTKFEDDDLYWQLGGPLGTEEPRLSLAVNPTFEPAGVYVDGVAEILSADDVPIFFLDYVDFMLRYRLSTFDIEYYVNGEGPFIKQSGPITNPGNWGNPTTFHIGGSGLVAREGLCSFLGFIITSNPDFPLLPTQPPELIEAAFEDGLSGFHFLSIDTLNAFPSVVNAGAGFAGIDSVEAGSQVLATAASLIQMDEATK